MKTLVVLFQEEVPTSVPEARHTLGAKDTYIQQHYLIEGDRRTLSQLLTCVDCLHRDRYLHQRDGKTQVESIVGYLVDLADRNQGLDYLVIDEIPQISHSGEDMLEYASLAILCSMVAARANIPIGRLALVSYHCPGYLWKCLQRYFPREEERPQLLYAHDTSESVSKRTRLREIVEAIRATGELPPSYRHIEQTSECEDD